MRQTDASEDSSQNVAVSDQHRQRRHLDQPDGCHYSTQHDEDAEKVQAFRKPEVARARQTDDSS